MSTIKTNTLQNVAGTLSVPVDTVVQGSAKAWVNFNGTGTVAIRAAFNVSSITDNGVGNYTVNFTNAMTNANFFGAIAQGEGAIPASVSFSTTAFIGEQATGSIKIYISGANGNVADKAVVGVSIFR